MEQENRFFKKRFQIVLIQEVMKNEILDDAVSTHDTAQTLQWNVDLDVWSELIL